MLFRKHLIIGLYDVRDSDRLEDILNWQDDVGFMYNIIFTDYLSFDEKKSMMKLVGIPSIFDDLEKEVVNMSENLKLYYDNSLFEAEARGKSESSRMIYKLLDLVRAGKTDQEILDEVKEATPEDIEEMRSHLK